MRPLGPTADVLPGEHTRPACGFPRPRGKPRTHETGPGDFPASARTMAARVARPATTEARRLRQHRSSGLNPNSDVGNEIEKTRREPTAVGRVTPCAPRLPPAGAKFSWWRILDPQSIKTFIELPTADVLPGEHTRPACGFPRPRGKPRTHETGPGDFPASARTMAARVARPATTEARHLRQHRSSGLNPNSDVGNEIEKTRREPTTVGRVTPCAPRLPPAGAKFSWRRLPDPRSIKTFLELPVPTSEFGLNRPGMKESVALFPQTITANQNPA